MDYVDKSVQIIEHNVVVGVWYLDPATIGQAGIHPLQFLGRENRTILRLDNQCGTTDPRE